MSLQISLPSKETLLAAYVRSGATISALARLYQTSNPTIRKWLQHYQIPIKSHQQVMADIAVEHRASIIRPSRKELNARYATDTIDDLERRYHVGQECIYTWFQEYQIPRKPLDQACREGNHKEFLERLPTEIELRNVYASVGFNCKRLVDHYKTSSGLIRKWMNYHNIKRIIPWRSKAETDLYTWCIEQIPTDHWEANNRTIIAPYELDIVNHTKKIAIDYAGLYWHSEKHGGKSSTYHQKKYQRCKEAGYQLLTVFETDAPKLIEALIALKCRATNIVKYRATKLTIIEDATACRTFEVAVHRQQTAGASVHLGLCTADGTIVQTMSFGRSRYSSRHAWELIRLATAPNSLVHGGAQKLFHHFITYHRPTSIVTYADLRFGEGSIYPHLGFTFSHYSQPNYWYFHPREQRLYSRQTFQKHKLATKLAQFEPLKTEWGNMIAHGYDRIWDCGNAVYTWKV